MSRQCDDFHLVCSAFGPLLTFEASLGEGRGSWASGGRCSADGEGEEVCEGIFLGGGLRRRLPGGFELPLRLLASPVEAAGRERVMRAQVAPAVGHAQTVARFAGEGHLHGDGALERQSAGSWLKT